jgi:hypothetical protein
MALLLGTFLVGGLSSYTTTVASRGPYGAERIAQQAAWRSVLGGLNILALFAALIWGFIHLTWYLVMLGAIGILLINGFIYGVSMDLSSGAESSHSWPFCASPALFLYGYSFDSKL